MENKFKLVSKFAPYGDQPEAIRRLTENVLMGVPEQTLLGATGTGKTFTIANVIEKIICFISYIIDYILGFWDK